MVTALKFRIRIYVEPDEDQFYAYCPELKGVFANGDTIQDAISNFKELAHVHIKSIIKHKDPLPLCAEEVDISFSLFVQKLIQKINSYFRPKNILVSQDEDLVISFA